METLITEKGINISGSMTQLIISKLRQRKKTEINHHVTQKHKSGVIDLTSGSPSESDC